MDIPRIIAVTAFGIVLASGLSGCSDPPESPTPAVPTATSVRRALEARGLHPPNLPESPFVPPPTTAILVFLSIEYSKPQLRSGAKKITIISGANHFCRKQKQFAAAQKGPARIFAESKAILQQPKKVQHNPPSMSALATAAPLLLLEVPTFKG